MTNSMRTIITLLETITSWVVYHITPIENLDDIMTTGLVPQIGPRSLALGEPKPAIYFFPTLDDVDTALSQWAGRAFDEDSEVALLRVTLPDTVTIFSDAGYECHTYDTIPPGCFRVLSTDVFGESDIVSLTEAKSEEPKLKINVSKGTIVLDGEQIGSFRKFVRKIGSSDRKSTNLKGKYTVNGKETEFCVELVDTLKAKIQRSLAD